MSSTTDEPVNKDNDILECVNCRKRTTKIEAECRNFNTNFCAYCGYGLELVLDEPVNKQLDEILDEYFSISETDPVDIKIKAKQSLLLLIQSIGKEVIGEDTLPTEPIIRTVQDTCWKENRLKAEQRDRLNKLLQNKNH